MTTKGPRIMQIKLNVQYVKRNLFMSQVTTDIVYLVMVKHFRVKSLDAVFVIKSLIRSDMLGITYKDNITPLDTLVRIVVRNSNTVLL